MAEQLSNGMNKLSLDSQAPAAPAQQPAVRSYIPPHLRAKMAQQQQQQQAGANGSATTPSVGGGPSSTMSGLNNSAWAKYVLSLLRLIRRIFVS